MLANFVRTASSDMRIRHIIISNSNTINTRGVKAGSTKDGSISQPLLAAAVPGSVENKASIIAVKIRMSRKIPRSLSKFI